MLSVVLRRAVLAAVLCAFASIARADEPTLVTIERTTGEPLRGRLLDLTGRSFRVQLADGRVVEVPERDVREVRFDAPPEPRRPQPPTYRTIHGAPTATIVTRPGTVHVAFELFENEYVIASTELWRRAGDGPWSKVASRAPAARGEYKDTPPDPRAAYTYKVVSVGRADRESPVVQRYGLTVPEDEVRQESTLLGPVTPGRRSYVVPLAVFADGGALLDVHAFGEHQWGTHQFRVEKGQPIGSRVEPYDFTTGATLEAARIEAKPGERARLVARLRHVDGRVEEVDDRQELPDAVRAKPVNRGVVVAAPTGAAAPTGPAAPDRDAAVREALTSQRPLTLSFPLETPLRDVIPLLRDLTGVDVVASAEIDQDHATLRFDVRNVPQAELLALAFEMVHIEARPWCGVMWLSPRGAGDPWVRPAASGAAGALLERARVSLELERFPINEALDLLRGQTGLNIVLSGGAQDLIDNEKTSATINARDLSLRDALTLIVDGTGTLHWHARGSVVQVLTWQERPTREVLVEQLLCGIATRNFDLVRSTVGIPAEDTSMQGSTANELARKALALGDEPGTLTAERLVRALRLEPAANGTWNFVGLVEPAQEASRDAATTGPWDVTIDSSGPTRFMALSLERQELLPVSDLQALARATADLWIEPKASILGPLAGDALGLDLGTSRAAVAIVDGPVAQLLQKPGETQWQQQLPYVTLTNVDLLVRTQSGRLFLAHLSKEGPTDRVMLRFTPLAEAKPLREATDLADAPAPPTAPQKPARTAWKVTINAAVHGERALLWLSDRRAERDGPIIVTGGDLWVDPAGPSISVVAQLAVLSSPTPAIAPLTEPDASGTRHLTWTDTIPGAALVPGFRFLVRTSGGQLYEGRVERRGEGVLELTFARQ